jgi:hypothetical protein
MNTNLEETDGAEWCISHVAAYRPYHRYVFVRDPNGCRGMPLLSCIFLQGKTDMVHVLQSEELCHRPKYQSAAMTGLDGQTPDDRKDMLIP